MKRYIPLAVIGTALAAMMVLPLATASNETGKPLVRVGEPRAVIYTTDDCRPCKQLVADLESKGWRVGNGPGDHFALRLATKGMTAPTIRVGSQQLVGYDGTRAGLAAVIHLYRNGSGGQFVSFTGGSSGSPRVYDDGYGVAQPHGATVQLAQGSAGGQSYYGQGYYGGYGAYSGGSNGGGGGGFAPSFAPYGGGYGMPYSGGSGGGGFQPSYGYPPPQMMPPQGYYPPMPQMHPHYQGYGGGQRMICGPNGCFVQ